jgi:hypothetical protein
MLYETDADDIIGGDEDTKALVHAAKLRKICEKQNYFWVIFGGLGNLLYLCTRFYEIRA